MEFKFFRIDINKWSRILMFPFFFGLISISCQQSGSGDPSNSPPSNTTPPTIVSCSTIPETTDLKTEEPIVITFSEKMDASSITSNTDNNSCSGSIQVSTDGFNTCVMMEPSIEIDSEGKTFTLTPQSYPTDPTYYVLKVTTGVKDINGNYMLGNYLTSDNIAPRVKSITPSNGAPNVLIGSTISITFSEPMLTSSITVNTSDIQCSGSIQVSRVGSSHCVKMASQNPKTTDAVTFFLTPDVNLDAFADYEILVSNSVFDFSGSNSMDKDTTSDFSTIPIDWIDSIHPANEAVDQSPNGTIIVTFSQAMLPTSVTAQTDSTDCSGSIQLSADGFEHCVAMTTAEPSVDPTNKTFTFKPASPLTESSYYQVRITSDVKDETGGNGLQADYTQSDGFLCFTDTEVPVISLLKINDGNPDIETLWASFEDSTTDIAVYATDNVGIVSYAITTTDVTPDLNSWTPVDRTKDFSLSYVPIITSGIGPKTFYVWVKDNAGNIGSSSDTINYTDGLIKLAGGPFTMGLDFYYPPAHDVNVNSFSIMSHEVTAGQYTKCVESDVNPCSNKFSGAIGETYGDEEKQDFPINNVDWDDAQSFIIWMNSQAEGTITYRLCSEAEWEYAARAGTTSKYYCGLNPECMDSYAWYGEADSGSVHEVKTKSPNTWGLYDMFGNVSEWVQDAYHTSYDVDGGAPDDGSAWEVEQSGHENEAVLRGGNWYMPFSRIESAHRLGDPKSRLYIIYGFRICADTSSD